MTELAVGTIVSQRFLPLARVLADSFRRHHPDVPFFVLFIDDEISGAPSKERAYEPLSLSDLSGGDWQGWRFRYTEQELTYAVTPVFLEHLLQQGFQRAVFFKQESLVTGSLTPIFQELETCSILLAPHLLSPLTGQGGIERELNILLSGVFNVGCLGVSQSAVSKRFLNWWQDRLREHCQRDVAEGLHFEQRWLDLVLAYFDDVRFLRDPGINVGHWNLPERRVERSGNGWTVDGEPCRFVRFSGYDPTQPDMATRYNSRLTQANLGPIRHVFQSYHEKLNDAGYEEHQARDYAFDRFENQVPIPAEARKIHRSLGESAERFGDPFATSRAGCFFRWLTESPEKESGLSPFWRTIYEGRCDLQSAFPDPEAEDRERFVEWTRNHGRFEHGVSDEFVLNAAG